MKKHKNKLTLVIAAAAAVSFAAPSFAVIADEIEISNGRSGGNCSFELPDISIILGGDDYDDLMLLPNSSPLKGSVDLYGELEALPESFDMRKVGLTSSVKNQNPYGTCWTFSAAASAESSLLKYKPSIDLSELHTAFFTHYGDSALYMSPLNSLFDFFEEKSMLDIGGNSTAVANLWAQWNGAVDENVLPYVDTKMFADEEFKTPDDEYAEQFQYLSDYHLENAYLFDYSRDGSDRDEVNEVIKQFIYSGHVVDTSYYSGGYSYSTNACYSDKSPKKADHSVSIVGWDDNFTANNFNGSKGAWLMKNSWGSHFGDNGYFWISYADTSLCEFAVFEITDSENYADIYFHDSMAPSQALCADDDMSVNKPSYAANIFTAERSEQIEAISTYISKPFTEYEITVYTDLTDVNDPASGNRSQVTSGVSDLTGYITAELDEDIVIGEGETFSVVVKYYCEDNKFVIPLESCTYTEHKQTHEIDDFIGSCSSYAQICSLTAEGESFYSEDCENWIDVTDEDYSLSDEEKYDFVDYIFEELDDTGKISEEKIAQFKEKIADYDLKIKMGNVSIKAFTNPVNTVDFSHISGNVPLDEKVELSVKSGDTVFCSVNGGEFFEYSEPFEITEPMKITATSDFKNMSSRSYEPAYSELIELDYKEKTKDEISRDNIKADRIDAHTYDIMVNGAVEEIMFYPISAAKIMLNGEVIASDSYTGNLPLEYGKNEFIFELTSENGLDNTVAVSVFRGYAAFDIESETVSINGADSLIAADGHIFKDGESVSDYAGQTLTAVVGSENVEVKVPERAVLPEFEMDHLNETLNFIPNEAAEYLEISTDGGKSFSSAEGRLIDGRNITSGMVMNKAVRVIPGETIIMRIAPGRNMFGSVSEKYRISAASSAPDEDPQYSFKDGKIVLEYSDVLEYGKINDPLTEQQLADQAKSFGYSVEKYSELMMKRFGINSKEELLKALAIEWDSVFTYEGSSAVIAVRSYSTEKACASKMKYIDLVGILKGDVNFDGVINAVDSSKVLSAYAAISTGKDPQFDDAQKKAADYNDDGKIDSRDASAILTYYAEKATGAR